MILKDGDIVNIDITVIVDGWHGDTSKMFLIGKSRPHVKRLVDITRECMFKGIEVCKPGLSLEILIRHSDTCREKPLPC